MQITHAIFYLFVFAFTNFREKIIYLGISCTNSATIKRLLNILCPMQYIKKSDEQEVHLLQQIFLFCPLISRQ